MKISLGKEIPSKEKRAHLNFTVACFISSTEKCSNISVGKSTYIYQPPRLPVPRSHFETTFSDKVYRFTFDLYTRLISFCSGP